VDNNVRGECLGFTLDGCGQALPFTGSSWIPKLASDLVMMAAGIVLV
jgi:hypothetical protein